MEKFKRYAILFIMFFIPVIFFTSCKEFFDPEQKLDITEDNLYIDWYEYRSVAMGMYAIQHPSPRSG